MSLKFFESFDLSTMLLDQGLDGPKCFGPQDMMPYRFYRQKKCDARQGHVPGEWSQCKCPLDVACAICISILKYSTLSLPRTFGDIE